MLAAGRLRNRTETTFDWIRRRDEITEWRLFGFNTAVTRVLSPRIELENSLTTTSLSSFDLNSSLNGRRA
jgi:hypothetical protein